MAWTDERVELLKKFWSEGLSASQIAGKLGGVTRNAVIGKVHRLGLSGRAAPARPERGRAPQKPRQVSAGSAPPRHTEAKPTIPEPEFTPPLVLSDGERTTVSTLKGGMCKWPVGDPTSDTFHFCGQPALTGKPYCAYHAHMAFQPNQKKERKPDIAPVLTKRAVGM
ncbi:MAG: GcrA family cell cycle regulator [Pseudomonadota bacterium]